MRSQAIETTPPVKSPPLTDDKAVARLEALYSADPPGTRCHGAVPSSIAKVFPSGSLNQATLPSGS
jgi:hypothetical protein